MRVHIGILSVPWVAFCVSGSCGELLGVEPGDGGALRESDTVAAGQHWVSRAREIDPVPLDMANLR